MNNKNIMNAVLSTKKNTFRESERRDLAFDKLEKILLSKRNPIRNLLSEIGLIITDFRYSPLYSKEELAELFVENNMYDNVKEAMPYVEKMLNVTHSRYNWEIKKDPNTRLHLYTLRRQESDCIGGHFS